MSNSGTAAEHQNCLNAHFKASSAYWTDIYEIEDVDGTIYRERRSVVLALAQELGLPAGARILEVGCGSGLTSVQLALEGYTIQAVDSVDAMIERTREHADRAGVGDRIIASVRSVYDLRYPDSSFDLVLKIGVAPWLYSLDKALRDEMKVESVGGNKYALDFDGSIETIEADGTDQPGNFGITLSVSVLGPGRTIITATWTLSQDGNTHLDSPIF